MGTKPHQYECCNKVSRQRASGVCINCIEQRKHTSMRVNISSSAQQQPLISTEPSKSIPIKKSGPGPLVSAALPPKKGSQTRSNTSPPPPPPSESNSWIQAGKQAWKEAHEPHDHRSSNSTSNDVDSDKDARKDWSKIGKRAWQEEHEKKAEHKKELKKRLQRARKEAEEAPVKEAERTANILKAESNFKVKNSEAQSALNSALARAARIENRAKFAEAVHRARSSIAESRAAAREAALRNQIELATPRRTAQLAAREFRREHQHLQQGYNSRPSPRPILIPPQPRPLSQLETKRALEQTRSVHNQIQLENQRAVQQTKLDDLAARTRLRHQRQLELQHNLHQAGSDARESMQMQDLYNRLRIENALNREQQRENTNEIVNSIHNSRRLH